MKTVTVTDRELLVRVGQSTAILSVRGQSITVDDHAVITETGSAAIRPSSSWIGRMGGAQHG